MKRNRALALVLVALLSIGTTAVASAATKAKTLSFTAEVWADNWFSLYANGKKVGEDSVPITTERSFNSEVITFTASYPLTLGLVAKDYIANDSGLEYIGSPRQQIGDGGIIAQVRETKSGKFVTATGPKWRALVIHRAPLNPECVTSMNPTLDCKFEKSAEPKSWSAPTFKDSKWPLAHVFTEEEVGVKDGYLTIKWNPDAKLIWGSDLKLDNTILMRFTATGK
jgi:hypothetical protein